MNRILTNEPVYCYNITSALTRLHFQSAKRIICCAGWTAITVNPDGSIYSCQNLSSIPEASIGNLNSGIENAKLLTLHAVDVNTASSCQSCWLRYLCGGGCIAEKYVVARDTFSPVESRCFLKKVQWKNYLQLCQKLQNNCQDSWKGSVHRASCETADEGKHNGPKAIRGALK